MKRQWTLVFALLTLMFTMACGVGGGNATSDIPSEPTATEAPIPTQDEPTSEPTDEPTDEPTSEPTDEPTDEPTSEPTEDDITLVQGVFTKQREDNPTPTDTFYPDETVYLILEFEGQPASGDVSAIFALEGDEIARDTVDFADAEGRDLASAGQNMFVTFTLTPSQDMPISSKYDVDVLINDQPAETFSFEVVARDGATPAAGDTTSDDAPTSADTPVDESDIQYTFYTHPSGLFSTTVVEGWTMDETSEADRLLVRWDAPDKRALAMVTLVRAPEGLSDADLDEGLENIISGLFGDVEGFQMGSIEENDFGQRNLPFSMAPDGRASSGLASIQQRGDKVSVVITMRAESDAAKVYDKALRQFAENMIVMYNVDFPG